MFGKRKKKLDRKMRRRIRKTSAVMLLISAIVVAAIPVPEAEAAPESATEEFSIESKAGTVEEDQSGGSITFEKDSEKKSIIPDISGNDIIYSSSRENGYQFVYKTINSDPMAILLRGSIKNVDESGTLTIPDKVEAYVQNTLSQGGDGGYAAANQNGQVLYYEWISKYTYTRTVTVPVGTPAENINWSNANADGHSNLDSEYAEIRGSLAARLEPEYTETPLPVSGEDTTQTWQQKVVYYTYQLKACYESDKEWQRKDIVDNIQYYYRTNNKPDKGVLENFNYFLLPTAEQGYNDSKVRLLVNENDDEPSNFPAAKKGDYYSAAGDDNGWLHNVDVGAISSRRVELETTKETINGAQVTKQKWVLLPENAYETEDFIAGGGSIGKLRLPATLRAIGKNTFYNCASLNDVEFLGDYQLQEIGPSAFENCRNMTSLKLPHSCTIKIIPEYTFRGCESLNKFVLPFQVEKIGDEAFKGCKFSKITMSANEPGQEAGLPADDNLELANPPALKKLGLHVFEECKSLTDVEGLPSKLETIGYGTFKNCSGLKHVTLPDSTSLKPLRYSTFEGCKALEWIDVRGYSTTFDSTDYTYNVESFKQDVRKHTDIGDVDSFYFIGEDSGCAIHGVTSEYEIAFMYRNGDFEKIIHDKENDNIKYTYIRDKNGAVSLDITGGTPSNVVIESYIGAFPITSISETFSSRLRDKSLLKSIQIPSSIETIEKNAFRGCSSLETVIFDDPEKVSIGEDAFYTQYYTGNDKPSRLTELTFYGKIYDFDDNSKMSAFKYAMTYGNTINNETQPETYIDYCSGAPSYIHVKFKPDPDPNPNGQGKREVWKVPTITDKEYLDAVEAAIEASPVVSGNDPLSAEQVVTAYKAGTISLTPIVEQAVKPAFEIILPPGIQTIKSGLFSKAKENTYTGKNKKDYDDAEKKAEKDAEERTQRESDNKLGSTPIKENAMENSYTGAKGFERNDDIKSIVINGIDKIDNYAFYGCANLESVTIYPSQNAGAPGTEIGNYAFAQCKELEDVVLPLNLKTMGTRPFAGDPGLENVYFSNPPVAGVEPGARGTHFACANNIIYELGNNGRPEKIIECLESRNSDIGADEVEGITSIAPEAFMNCNKSSFKMVNLSKTSIEELPKFCFANASYLEDIVLPDTCEGGREFACKDTALDTIDMPCYVESYDETAFYDSEDRIKRDVTVITAEDNKAVLALIKRNSPYNWSLSKKSYTVEFVDYDMDSKVETVIARVTVNAGTDATPPNADNSNTLKDLIDEHAKAGEELFGWIGKYVHVGKNTTVYTDWRIPSAVEYVVTFLNDDWSPLLVDDEETQLVKEGKSAKLPIVVEPKLEENKGKTSDGWISRPTGISTGKITADVEFMAHYPSKTGTNNPGGDSTLSGNNGGGGSNNPSGGNNGNNTNSGNNANQTLYTLTVVNGSGSGSYTAGTQVTVAAYTPNTGYEFYNWTSSESDTDFTSKTLAATSFKMPAKNLTVTANYKTKSETGNSITSKRTTGTVTSAPSSNTGSVNKVNSSSGSNSGSGNSGSSVQVNRPGISNGDVASATVNGSTDNFVVKVTEDGQATMAVAEALRNEYGSLDNIRYFAMDISLYDETGTKKVTDTSGLSVTMTLPIPDELRQYAGNNKVGAVTGGNNLDKLNARFTTVNGVPCVTFTATHFSPYTVYVDTANLSAGGYDATPKTGDAIHPKWFLAIGLALFSAVLFLKKDKKVSYNAA